MQIIKDMIFKSLHENLLKKKINKSLLSLEAQNRSKPSPIKTLGCIVDPMFPVDVNNFINLANRIGLKDKDLKIIINGGIQSIEDGNEIILKHNLDGFMIGREAYKNPYILSTVDRDVFGKDVKQRTRYEVAMKMADYIDNYMKKDGSQVHAVTRHMLGLYNSLPGAKDWRRVLSENTKFSKNGDVLRLATDNIEDVIHRKNLKLA